MTRSRQAENVASNWIKGATDTMKAKGTLGSFGKATSGKIASMKAKGGLSEKKAVFAQNMKSIGAKRQGKLYSKKATM